MAKKKGVIKGFFSSLVDVRKWANFDEVGDNARFISRTLKELLNREPLDGDKKSGEKVTFAVLAQRMQWSEDDIKARTKYFGWVSLTYTSAGLLLLLYTGYLIHSSDRFLAIIATLVLGVLMLSYAVRELFWYVQMKQRKLGCNMQDVMNVLLGRSK